jgi:hypothetical protein
MTATAFTPAREEARVHELVAAVRSRGLDGPLWLLCPHEGRRGALLDHIARAGGGWIHPLDWHGLLDLMEHRLGLASRPLLAPVDRLLVVESALEHAAAHDRALSNALRGNALDVARAVAGVIDTLRLHGWDGELPAPSDARAHRVALGHLGILSKVNVALSAHLATTASTDLPDRLARFALTPPRPVLRGVLLWVDGTDRLSPREADALSLAAACGANVSRPPWIELPADALDPDATAATLLDALREGAARAATDDGSLSVHSVNDPLEEAEAVAALVDAHLSSGGRAEDVAVVCGPECGAWPRVARALDRWGIPWNGGGSLPVQQSPLWQIVRASLRLAWNGPDAIDLATVLAAPGSGIFGSERDYFLSQLRRQVPSTWADVRALLEESTAVDDPEDGVAPDPADASRRARGEQIRKRVGALFSAWESDGPLRDRTADQRADLLPEVFEGVVVPLLDPVAIARAVHDPRACAVWIAAAEAIRSALDLVRRRLASASHRARRLHDVERLLTDLEATFPVLRDSAPSARRDGVSLLGEDSWRCDHPGVLIVTGFLRGRHPRIPGPSLLLGPAERELLASLSTDLGALPDEEVLHALARRATLRMLASPRRRLVLLSPRRTADGDHGEVALALRDLLDRLPSAPASTDEFPSSAVRSRAASTIRALGRGDVAAALASGSAIALADLSWRDLFAARLRPDTSFSVGALVRSLVRSREHSAADLEALLTCHYRYLMTSLLDLRPAPLRRRPRLSESVRHAVGRTVMARLEDALALGPSVPRATVEEAVESVVQQHAPWSQRPDQHDERRQLVADCIDLADRYLELRHALPGASLEPVADAVIRPLLSLDDGSPLMVQMPAATTLRIPHPGGVETPVLVQLTRARAASLAQRRDLGLDVEGALLAQAPSGGAGAVLRLNLSSSMVDVMTAEQAPEADAALDAMVGGAVRNEWIHKAQLTLDDHAAAASARLAEALAEIDASDGLFAPIEPDRAESLDKVKALPCPRCDARLGCRVGLAGGGS